MYIDFHARYIFKYLVFYYFILVMFISQLLKPFYIQDLYRDSILICTLLIIVILRIFKTRKTTLPFLDYNKFIFLIMLFAFLVSLKPILIGYVINNQDLKMIYKWSVILFSMPVFIYSFDKNMNINYVIVLFLLLIIFFVFAGSAYHDIAYSFANKYRYMGIFNNSIMLSSYIFLLSTVAIAFVDKQHDVFKFLVILFTLVFSIYIYMITVNKQNLLLFTGFVCQICILLLFRQNLSSRFMLKKDNFIILLLFCFFIFFVGFLFFDSIYSVLDQGLFNFWKQRLYFNSMLDLFNVGRLVTIENGIEIIAKKPFLGTGYGMIHEYLYSANARPSTVHNTPIHLMATSGIFLGLFGYFIIFIYFPFKMFFSSIQDRGGLIFIIGYICFFIQSLFESVIHKEHFYVYLSMWILYIMYINKFYKHN